jgi:hypothetical protein
VPGDPRHHRLGRVLDGGEQVGQPVAAGGAPLPAGPPPDRSAPAQKAGPWFVSTITPTASSASAASRPPASPAISAGVSALRLCGWSMVSVATASVTTYRTASSPTATHPFSHQSHQSRQQRRPVTLSS